MKPSSQLKRQTALSVLMVCAAGASLGFLADIADLDVRVTYFLGGAAAALTVGMIFLWQEPLDLRHRARASRPSLRGRPAEVEAEGAWRRPTADEIAEAAELIHEALGRAMELRHRLSPAALEAQSIPTEAMVAYGALQMIEITRLRDEAVARLGRLAPPETRDLVLDLVLVNEHLAAADHRLAVVGTLGRESPRND